MSMCTFEKIVALKGKKQRLQRSRWCRLDYATPTQHFWSTE